MIAWADERHMWNLRNGKSGAALHQLDTARALRAALEEIDRLRRMIGEP
jgi:hypothetical protein